jgi:hypothetical protein
LPVCPPRWRKGSEAAGWLDDYVTKHVKLPAAQRSRLLAGDRHRHDGVQPVQRSGGVRGGVGERAGGPLRAAINDIERFEPTASDDVDQLDRRLMLDYGI